MVLVNKTKRHKIWHALLLFYLAALVFCYIFFVAFVCNDRIPRNNLGYKLPPVGFPGWHLTYSLSDISQGVVKVSAAHLCYQNTLLFSKKGFYSRQPDYISRLPNKLSFELYTSQFCSLIPISLYRDRSNLNSCWSTKNTAILPENGLGVSNFLRTRFFYPFDQYRFTLSKMISIYPVGNSVKHISTSIKINPEFPSRMQVYVKQNKSYYTFTLRRPNSDIAGIIFMCLIAIAPILIFFTESAINVLAFVSLIVSIVLLRNLILPQPHQIYMIDLLFGFLLLFSVAICIVRIIWGHKDMNT